MLHMPTECLTMGPWPPRPLLPETNTLRPIDLTGHQAPPTTLRDTPGTQCCPAARQPMAICLATSGTALQGNLAIAPRTRRWLLSDWNHLPSTRPSRPNIFSPHAGDVWRFHRSGGEIHVPPHHAPGQEIATLVTQKAPLPLIRIMYKRDQTTKQ